MSKYKSLHLWMILPMVFMQLGIFKDYWGDFFDNAWSVHIHYWTGTVWYLYLIIQPYFATHGQLPRHRTNGIIGMFLAGGVCLTALSHSGIFAEAGSYPEQRKSLVDSCPMKRLAEVEDVANIAEFFASDLSSFVNGQHLLVNGGANQ